MKFISPGYYNLVIFEFIPTVWVIWHFHHSTYSLFCFLASYLFLNRLSSLISRVGEEVRSMFKAERGL